MASIGSPVRGRITRIFVQLGQTVHAGTPLFAVAGPDIPDALARYERAKLELAAVEATRQRIAALVRADALAAKEELSAEYLVHRARLARRAASARLRAWSGATGAVGELIVKSPRAGTVTDRRMLLGQAVDGGQSGLLTVADLSTVWVLADLLESEAYFVQRGTRARIVGESSPDVVETAVEAVAPVIDRERHSSWVRMELDNRDKRFRPNARARVEFFAEAPPAGVDIPSSAVMSDGSNNYVYTQEGDGLFKRRPVTVGATRQGFAAVTAGLIAGEAVVEQGAALLDNELTLLE